jgi:hypothetical protein
MHVSTLILELAKFQAKDAIAVCPFRSKSIVATVIRGRSAGGDRRRAGRLTVRDGDIEIVREGAGDSRRERESPFLDEMVPWLRSSEALRPAPRN